MEVKRPRPKSLALPPYTSSTPATGAGLSSMMSTTTPTSILKRTGMSAGDLEADVLARTAAVQSRIEDETQAYKRRLESYRQAQHQQALLVARLQSKLLQYRQRCTDLESKLGQSPGQELYYGSSTPTGTGPGEFGGRGGGGGPPSDLEDALWRLEQEKVRNDNLMHLNRNLRSELDESRNLNDALSADLQRLSDDWDKLTRQMTEREQMWKAEEQAYSDQYASEHSKLLNLWKKVSATKRDFAEMKSSTGRDIAQLKNALARMSNQISSGVITAVVASPSPQQEAQQASFIAQLTQEVHNAQNTHENLRRQLKDRDDRVANLEATIADLEGKMQGLDQELSRVTNQELGLLNNSLKEIAKLLLSDFDQHGLEDGHDLHLTSAPSIFVYDDSEENPTVFAESIVSAVQASLNKRQLQIHQLQVNLASSKEQAMVSRGHVESLESDLSKAEDKLTQLVDLNEKLKDELENAKMERDSAQRGLDNLKNEKNILESQRKTLASELESTLKIKNNMSTSLTKLEKSMEASRDEIDVLTLELDKIRDDLTSVLSQLKLEKDLNTRMREQLTSTNEDKEKNSSENKTLKSQVNEYVSKYEDLSFQFERSEDSLKKWKMDAEILAEKLRASNERIESLEKEKKKHSDRARQLEAAKSQAEADLVDARNDLTSLRREMLDSERIRTDLEARIEKLVAQADGAENKKHYLETQLDANREEYLREMNLMSERIDMLTEELNQTRREYDETFQILDRTRADLLTQEKLHMEAVHSVETKETSIQNLTNTLDKMREEKNSLEELEQTLKSTLIERDKKLESLERQMADTKSKMTAELGVLKEKLSRAEMETKSTREKADQEKASMEAKFTKELTTVKANSGSNEEKIKSDHEEKLKTLRNDLESERKIEVTKLNGDIHALRQQIDSLRVQYEEALLRAENDKQQGLLLAQQDQQGLSDKIRLLERELDDLRNEKDRLKRDCEAKCNHEKNTAGSLRSELIKLKNELETMKQDKIDSRKQVEIRLSDIEQEREAALMLVEELRNKLRTAEEREAEIKRELNDLNRKFRDTEASGDHVRQELAETRRSLSEMSVEKEKSNSTVEQLKEELDRRETDLSILKKELTKAQNHLKNLEKVKSELEAETSTLAVKLDAASRDKAESNRHFEEFSEQMSQTKAQAAKLESELTEYKIKLEAETDRRDDAEAQWRSAKKLLEEAEAQLSMTKAEEERLSLKLAEAEERFGTRESHFMQLADENKQREKKLLEEKHNLNVCLLNVQQQQEQLTSKLSAAEKRLIVLADEKNALDRTKKESESKLAQIQSGLKRLGIATGAMDNPEAARRVMSTLQTQMVSLQQDRDTVASHLATAKDALTALEMTKTQLEDQLAQLTRNLQAARTENKSKDTVVFSMEKDLALKNSELTRMADRIREMEDNLKSRDDAIRSLRTEKEAQKDELEKTRQKLDDGRVQNDSKWAKAEVQVRALEGDLNRLALVLQQKDAHIQALEDKCTVMHRNVTELEERCASLTMTVEQLNIALEKSGQSEQDWKDKYNSTSRSASENSSQLNAANEKLRSYQRDKVLLEQERNTLSEKWESTSTALQDFKRQVQVLAEKNQKLRQQTEEMTRTAIDKQLKMAFSETGKEDMRQILADKLELQRKVDTLLDRIRDLERESREFERLKDSVPLKGVAARTPHIRDNAVTVLEEENSELRRKISKLEAEIRDLERRHTKHIAEVTTQVKQERDFELERARASKQQAVSLLEAREGNYREQIHRLEQQVTNLKTQLGEEIRRRQSFLSRSFRTGQEIRTLRQALGDSLRNVSLDPNTMDSETRRLDATLDLHKSSSQASLLSPMRDLSPGIGLKSSTPTPKMHFAEPR